MNHPLASPFPHGGLSELRTRRTRSNFSVVLCISFLVGIVAQPIASGAEPENTTASVVTATQSLHDVTQVVANNGLIFIVNSPSDRVAELWKSDGSVSGTTQINPTVNFPIYSNSISGAIPTHSDSGSSLTVITNLIAWRTGVAFLVGSSDPRDLNQLWVSDGTPGGTKQLPLAPEIGNLYIPQAYGNHLYFATNQGMSIFETDGTALIPNSEYFVATSTNIVDFGGGWWIGSDGIYSSWDDGALAYSEGLQSQSTSIGQDSNYPLQVVSNFSSFSSSIIYSATYGYGEGIPTGIFTWNRATNTNTFIASFSGFDAIPRSRGTYQSATSTFVNQNGIAYFASSNSLWQSDGTVSGTHVLPSAGVWNLLGTFLGNSLVYVSNVDSGKTLRKFNVVSGVDSLINTPAFESSPDNFVVLNSRLYLTARDSSGYSQLYSYAISPSDTQAGSQSPTRSSSVTYSSREIEEQIVAVKLQARMEIANNLKDSKSLSVEAFAKADIRGITSKNIADVQVEILALPEADRTDINQVIKIAHKYEVVGIIGSDAIKTIPVKSLVDVGLIHEASQNKMILLAAVKKLPESARDSYAEIKKVIDAENAVIEERKNRLEAAKSRNSNRYKK